MYLKEETAKLTGDLKNAVRKWAYGKIDELSASRPRLKAASVSFFSPESSVRSIQAVALLSGVRSKLNFPYCRCL